MGHLNGISALFSLCFRARLFIDAYGHLQGKG